MSWSNACLRTAGRERSYLFISFLLHDLCICGTALVLGKCILFRGVIWWSSCASHISYPKFYPSYDGHLCFITCATAHCQIWCCILKLQVVDRWKWVPQVQSRNNSWMLRIACFKWQHTERMPWVLKEEIETGLQFLCCVVLAERQFRLHYGFIWMLRPEGLCVKDCMGMWGCVECMNWPLFMAWMGSKYASQSKELLIANVYPVSIEVGWLCTLAC